VLQAVEEFTFDTLRLPMERIPAPIIYTLCMNIYDAETKEPIEASVRLTSTADTVVLYAAQSSDDGFIETPLTEGDYIAHLGGQFLKMAVHAALSGDEVDVFLAGFFA
jgi:hypothetical protein